MQIINMKTIIPNKIEENTTPVSAKLSLAFSPRAHRVILSLNSTINSLKWSYWLVLSIEYEAMEIDNAKIWISYVILKTP